MNDVWTTAKLLIERYNGDAPAVAESEAIDDLMCGDAAGSAHWERVVVAIESLLDGPRGTLEARASQGNLGAYH